MVLDLPEIPFEFISGSFPPITAVGSILFKIKICVIIEVTVVLPCVPHTPITLSKWRVSAPNICERSIVGIPCSRAALSSGLSADIAAEYTISSAPFMFSALCPIYTLMPRFLILVKGSLSLLSDPVRNMLYPCYNFILVAKLFHSRYSLNIILPIIILLNRKKINPFLKGK